MAFGDPLQWIIIGVIVVAIFLWGPQKIPQLAKALGSARREFDKATKEFQGAVEGDLTSSSSPKTGDEILLDTARQMGIETAGKTREQISQEILEKSKPQGSVST